jgi:hypothetical protein
MTLPTGDLDLSGYHALGRLGIAWLIDSVVAQGY